MIHTWLRNVLIGFVGLLVLFTLSFAYTSLSPRSRLGKYHEQQSYLVQPGMSAQQAMQLMGPPQKQEIRRGGVLYTYNARAFAEDNIYLAIDSTGVVEGINHGE
jgi:hypothetical protein